jgi:hypothetical protein
VPEAHLEASGVPDAAEPEETVRHRTVDDGADAAAVQQPRVALERLRALEDRADPDAGERGESAY